MTASRTCITVGLLWHSFSSDNLGVGALSESQVAICEAAARRAGVDVRFIVFGNTGGLDYIPAGSTILMGSPISLKQLFTGRSPFWRELEECDLVLDIGEGDSFADIYGMRRFRMQIATKIAVLAKRVPLILSPQTIGPFERWYDRWIATKIMKRCRHVFTRDGLSSDYLRSVGLGEKMSEAIDVAFRLPYKTTPHEKSAACRIGLNVSGLLFSGGYVGENQFGLTLDYPKLIRDLMNEWCADERYEVWLIPHVLSDRLPRDDDRKAIDILINEYPVAMRAPDFKSPSEAKSFIASMDFVTGARMHACIAALSSGVPVVPLAYSRKFTGLFQSLGYEYIADGMTMSHLGAMSIIAAGLHARSIMANAIVGCKQTANHRLVVYEDYLYSELVRIGLREVKGV